MVPGDEMQLALVLDLGVLDPLGGHGRGIDRQAKAEPPEPGSDDARMLAALQRAAFGLYRLRGPHPEGGAAAEAFPDGGPVHIHDNFLGQQPPGRLIGARLAWPEDGLAVTCGAVVPLDSRVLERLLLGLPPTRGPVLPSLSSPDEDEAAVAELLEVQPCRNRQRECTDVDGDRRLVAVGDTQEAQDQDQGDPDRA